MKKKYVILILILLLIGIIYIGLWVVSGIGFGPSAELSSETQTSDSQSGEEAVGAYDDSNEDGDSNTIGPGIVIDKDLLNKKIVIPTGEVEQEATTTIATTTLIITATTTPTEKPVIATTTESSDKESVITDSDSVEEKETIKGISSTTENITQ